VTMSTSIGGRRFVRAALLLLSLVGCGNGDDSGGTGTGETSTDCPSGSYAETCSDAVCSTDRIEATCQSQSYEGVSTSLALPCDGEISNCNGELTCGVCTVPSGNYAETCTDCSASSELLTCLSCREEGNAGSAASSLVLPCDENISNCDGELTCGECL
jgi:hypothetical protein